jgi:MSHA biogenesis protein MshL
MRTTRSNYKLHFICLCWLLVAGLQGCSSVPEQKNTLAETSVLQTIDKQLPQPAAALPVLPPVPPPEVRNALLLPLPSLPPVVEERFDIAVDQAPAATFFMSLVADSDTNMVVHPSVTGTISLKLKNVTLDEAMQLVRQAYGYEYEKSGLGYVVLPQRMQSQIFQVSYLNVQRQGESETRVSSGQATQVTPRNNSTTNRSTGERSGSGANITGSRIKTSTEADFWKELKESIETLIGTEDGRNVVISPQSGVVIVRALPSEIREVENFLEQVQASVHRQVVLEAKVIEVELNDGFQAGINWADLVSGGQNPLVVGQTGGGTIFDEGRSLLAGAEGNLNPLNPVPVENALTSGFGGVFSLIYTSNDFSAFIELLKTQGDVQVLSSPRVSTVNNQKAVIKVGTDEYFITNVQTNNQTGNTADLSSVDIELTPFFSGIALDVTPQIAADHEIILHIHPTISEVEDQTKQFTVNGRAQELPLALSKVRESDSIVRARSGQLVVIGGLMEDISKRLQAATPGLGDIPVLGNLFKHQKNSSKKSELVILLRPVVVEEQQDWDRDLHDMHQRIQGMRQPTDAM